MIKGSPTVIMIGVSGTLPIVWLRLVKIALKRWEFLTVSSKHLQCILGIFPESLIV